MTKQWESNYESFANSTEYLLKKKKQIIEKHLNLKAVRQKINYIEA